MTERTSPHPEEPDLHLAVTLRGEQLDFAACLTSALNFVKDHQQRHYLDDVTVIPGGTTGLRRLPGEELYEELQ
ncbi:hypothetical protein [Nocardia brasiliensis]|uniref:hypothetical protein n=1 Tax=Nocardia brasiliensis TaxID=37326 RepID=UPI0024568822|nr:hypothetical protein [Nocardia brasiliensis]